MAELADSGTFDAMARFAAYLPVNVVGELVGLNKPGRRQHAAVGGCNLRHTRRHERARRRRHAAGVIELGRYIRRLDRDAVEPGSWAARLFDAEDAGDLSLEEARAMIIDYIGPALDTTILATGHMVWRLANTPGAFDAVRAEPALIPSVVNETVRLASPIRGFTRYAAADYDASGTVIPQGDRVLVLFASANRDERHYADPDVFDVRRNPRDHVGFGHGAHTCAGMHLARLEMEVLLKALVDGVSRIETDVPKPVWNNVLQGLRTLPARFVRAA